MELRDVKYINDIFGYINTILINDIVIMAIKEFEGLDEVRIGPTEKDMREFCNRSREAHVTKNAIYNA